VRTLQKATLATVLGTLALALFAAPAMAAYIHPTSTGSFGSDGTNATTIPGLERLTFDQASHRLYTLNQNPPKIGAFDVPSLAVHTPTAGYPVSAPELGFRADIAVDRNSGNIYVVSSTGGLYGFDSAGAPLPGSFPVKTQGETPCGVGVDSQGHVWVSDTTSEKVKEYDASGAPIGTPVDVKNISGPCKIAFDFSNDDMYVAGSSTGLYRLTAASGYTERILLQDVRAYTLAVDSADHVVFAANIFENGVAAFDPTGRLLETVGAGAPPGLSPYGLAFDESTRALYLANPVTGKILVYPGVIVPDVTTEPQTGNATLNGSVDQVGGGAITECKFEYGEKQNFGGGQIQYTASIPCAQSTPITNPGSVTADVTGLVPFEREYDFRLVAKNANGTNRGTNRVFIIHRVSGLYTEPATAIGRETATLNGSFIGTDDETSYFFKWGTSEGNLSHSTPVQNLGKTTGNTSTPASLGIELDPGTTYYYRVVANNSLGQSLGNIASFTTTPSVLDLQTEPATNVDKESAELNGSFTGDNNDTHYYFEYGSSTTYGKKTAVADAGTTTGPTAMPPIALTELVQGKEYHFRIVAENSFGTTQGGDRVFSTLSAPAIIGASSSGLTATTADLNAVINPRGAQTSYRFEYGRTPDYGSVAPIPDGIIPAGTSDVSRSVHIDGLVKGAIYHFRVVASNASGEVASPDQVFNFYPESCPNDTVRQQTGADGLPDCRAYELVTPENAGNAMIYSANVPFSPTATSPSRAAFVGALGIVPGTQGASNVQGDLYVATRKTKGWSTTIVGLPVKQAYISGGPPWLTGESSMDKWYMNVETNASMSNMVMWNDGYFPGTYTLEEEGVESSNAPYLFDSNSGALVDRWPTNVGAIPGGQRFKGQTLSSEDLSHFVFKSNVAFLPGAPPGVVYDNDTAEESLKIVSLDEEGDPIDAGPVEMSRDGSHILMTVGGFRTRYRPTSGPGELFMRVDDEKTYDIAAGVAVQFAGMTPDGSKVYFTTNQALAEDGSDTDSSADLYQWSESSSTPNHLKLISIGSNGTAGNGDSCTASWTSNCNVATISTVSYAAAAAGLGGSPFSDSPLAANGDIFFLSPEQLVGDNGVTGAENLYYFHQGQLQFVTALEPGTPTCTIFGTCSETGVARIQVSPEGSHMAFLTSSRVTGYDNAGFSEMYTYDPSTGEVACASCLSGGAAPASNVTGSHNGLFMTDDGRVFFETTDAVVPSDTNEVADVYEFVNSRPRLISSGTAPGPNENTISTWGPGGTRPGLVGVSADGTDVYFATYDVLVGQDRNGDSIKMYDARTGGGFPFVPPRPGCAAADECHGAGSAAPAPSLNGTGASLGSSGNLQPKGKQKTRGSGKAHQKKKKGRKAGKKRHQERKGERR
jgi:hypothetical protein